MFDKILVCLDGSNLAEQILPYAIEQATHFNSKVILLQAFSISSNIAAAEASEASVVGADLIREEAQRLETEARVYLEKIAKSLQEKGLDVTCVVLQGQAGETIINYAQKENINLIALATHGHSGLGRVIFGSVADHVLRQSGLPVLIIKPRKMET
ncbi:MAG: universal stress protein [Dehalococcoidales bacterium]|nr:universal stress protein [Dehalococcoidales bacterium]